MHTIKSDTNKIREEFFRLQACLKFCSDESRNTKRQTKIYRSEIATLEESIITAEEQDTANNSDTLQRILFHKRLLLLRRRILFDDTLLVKLQLQKIESHMSSDVIICWKNEFELQHSIN